MQFRNFSSTLDNKDGTLAPDSEQRIGTWADFTICPIVLSVPSLFDIDSNLGLATLDVFKITETSEDNVQGEKALLRTVS